MSDGDFEGWKNENNMKYNMKRLSIVSLQIACSNA